MCTTLISLDVQGLTQVSYQESVIQRVYDVRIATSVVHIRRHSKMAP